jgi:PAS domain S-box-containing protein
MWLYDLETLEFLDVNAAAVARYGYTREEFLRMRISDLLFEEDAEALQAQVSLDRAVLEGLSEKRHRLRNGRVIDVEIASQTLRLGAQQAGFVVVHDITDRKKAERALKQSEIQKAAIFESALDCIISMDVDGRVVEFNPAAERTFGYRRSDAVGKPLADLIIPPNLRQAHRDGLLRAAAGQHTLLGNRIELRAMNADGAEFPVEVTITRLQSEVGGRILYTGFLRNISDRKRAEEDLLSLNAELEERVRQRTAQLQVAVDELEAFSYSVSHDLRAPLRSIDGFSQALVEDAGPLLSAQTRSHVDRICGATHRMAQLIDDLLTLSKVSRGDMKHECIDVSDLANRIVGELHHRTPARSVKLTIAPAMVANGDARLLRIAFENLLENAWKFTGNRADAHIEVGQKSRDGLGTVYYVRDNGAGFDPVYVGKLFGPFQRLHAASEFQGSGIGLATVRRIIHRPGGLVWAEGHPGQGACFYFTLG